MPSSNMALFLAVLAGIPCSMAGKTYGYGHGYNSTIASGTATGTGIATGTGTPTLAACGIVSSLASVAKDATPSATPTVDAKLAHDCLNSVPLNVTAALEYVTGLEPYIEWQSDLVDLKDPPADYFYPPYDPLAKLASVKSNLEKGGVYANEYEFQQDLYQVFTPAHDGHFVVYPDLLTAAFEWRRQRSLVSISSDGVEVPKIYLYEDIISAPSEASEVTEINGVDAVKYVEDWIFQASFNQDADSAYNTMFYEKAFVAGGVSKGYFASGGRIRYIYPGSNTTFGFENGTTLVTENYANVKGDFTGVTDGKSFYQKFCVPATTESAKATASAPAAATVTATGYPTPVVITNDTIVGGYYLSEPGFEDVAVLSLLAFESDSIAEFQAVTQAFLADAVRDGKTKLIVDLQANGGGYILQGYDEFRQLFPHIVQDGYSRMREHDTFLTISKIFSEDIPADYDPNTASSDLISEYETWFNYRYDYNLTNQPFLTFEDKFAPHVYKGDNYTNLMRWNLDDPLTTVNSTYGMGIEISGYGSLSNLTQPFAAENIVMIYDGYCASTCTLFSEFMRIQAGVKSIAFGGRPSSGAIQGVGGIKGAQVLSFDSIYYYAQFAASSPNATPEDIAILNRLTTFPIERSTATSINLRDAILPDNVNDGLPAQYVVEEADCRLYWTAPMITDVEKVWEAAATAAWGGGACVAGAGLPYGKRDVLSKNSKTKEKKPAINRKRERNTLAMKKRDENVEKDPLWNARHGKKIIS
ncbi:hypothetical protein BCON_0135g00230 [Botryotinia convoluta]|uniref:CPAF-like PDZ domain-containing protein n=1 Tax=Botryotinia convoluta TaxID=54673 RepID=A0A4Z1HVH9_9HELO|nr:hypothetical protein BCON_0135g00230 [Botryotinia convoluta]